MLCICMVCASNMPRIGHFKCGHPWDHCSVPLQCFDGTDSMCMYVYSCSAFWQALEQYADCPERVGECFIQHVSLCYLCVLSQFDNTALGSMGF